MWTSSSLLLGLLLSGVFGLECPFSWEATGGLCLRKLGLRSFPDAVTECKNSGGRLFEPRTEILGELLLSILKESGERLAWLGIDNSRYLSDNKPIEFRQQAYISNIGIMDNSGYWSSLSNDTFPFLSVCELPLTNTECATVATIFVEDSFEVKDNNACQDACASTVGCKFWTFGLGQCGLRFYEAGALVGGGIPGVASTGFPNSFVANGGRVLVGKATGGVKNARDCQKLCSKDPKCNSFTWTNVDEVFGGINTETCVFNYGKILRKIPLPDDDSTSFNVVSGPPSC